MASRKKARESARAPAEGLKANSTSARAQSQQLLAIRKAAQNTLTKVNNPPPGYTNNKKQKSMLAIDLLSLFHRTAATLQPQNLRNALPFFFLSIDEMLPSVPAENRVVHVIYSITSFQAQTVAGVVTARLTWAPGSFVSGTSQNVYEVGIDPYSPQPYVIDYIDGGGNRSGVLSFVAPPAGKGHILEITFAQTNPALERSVRQTIQFDTTARFAFRLDGFHCDNPRSSDKDTLDVYAVASDRNPPSSTPEPLEVTGQLKRIPNVGAGDTVAVNYIPTSGIDVVPGTNNFVALEIGLYNIQPTPGGNDELHKETTDWSLTFGTIWSLFTFIDSFNDTSEDSGSQFPLTLDPVYMVMFYALFEWFSTDCTGPVLGDVIVINAETAMKLTTRGNPSFGTYVTGTRFYAGIQSDLMCGEISNYSVQYTLIRQTVAGELWIPLTLPGLPNTGSEAMYVLESQIFPPTIVLSEGEQVRFITNPQVDAIWQASGGGPSIRLVCILRP